MPEPLTTFLSHLLEKGNLQIGQLTVTPDFVITPTDDLARSDLRVFTDPHDAIDLVRVDDSGQFRPLKAAPNLRHGWQLRLNSITETLQALDFIYPAAIGNAAAFEQHRLPITNLRETLARQSGMYAVVSKITDTQAETVIADLCQKSCLRHRLWTVRAGESPELPVSSSTFPLWCPEACNLFVAAGRSVVKSASI